MNDDSNKPTWASAPLHPPSSALSPVSFLCPHRTVPPATGSVLFCPDDSQVVLEIVENGNVLALPQLS